MRMEGSGCGCIEAERHAFLGTIMDLVGFTSLSSGYIKYGSVDNK